MIRAYDSFVLLRAVAVVVAVCTIVWSIGYSSARLAQAANVTSFSDTLSDSAPGVGADHTVEFVTPSGMSAGGTLTITFASAFGNIAAITATDVDLVIAGSDVSLASSASGATWGVSTTSDSVVLTSDTGAINPDDTVVIRIGTNAAFGGTGTNQITNPVTPNSYVIAVDVDGEDSGQTRVAIVDEVVVTASVDTVFTFTVSGVGGGETVNSVTTTGTSTATEIVFGTLQAGVASTTAQDLTVVTNASNGFVVTVQTDQQLQASNNAIIEGFIEGQYTSTPAEWVSPNPVIGQSNTYGHWGITTDDATLTESLSDIFDVSGSGNRFVSASTTPVEVLRHDGPVNGVEHSDGTARVGYRVEISALQPAGSDYTATLTYVATPIF